MTSEYKGSHEPLYESNGSPDPSDEHFSLHEGSREGSGMGSRGLGTTLTHRVLTHSEFLSFPQISEVFMI